MKILVIGNFSDRRCGFQNFSAQTVRALANAGHAVVAFDGTYDQVYARQQAGAGPLAFLPADAATFDVIHVIWHPATLNHYSGCTWPSQAEGRPVLSVWNGCPAAWCPFGDLMDVRWGVLGTEPHHQQIWYPIPDWVADLPPAHEGFTVGATGVRQDGVSLVREICARHGWATNLNDPAGPWLTQEDEIRRLARSSVNVCWYGGEHDDRSGGAMVCLASRRPLICNDVRMMLHLKPYANLGQGITMGHNDPLRLEQLLQAAADQHLDRAVHPRLLVHFGWTRAVTVLEEGWTTCR